MEKRDNYQIQAAQAKALFLTYDQEKLIEKCRLQHDERYLYVRFLGSDYRICRKSGDMQRWSLGAWVDANSFGEVMTLLDWLCDCREDRYITGRWVNIVSQGPAFHGSLQQDSGGNYARLFNQRPEAFRAACVAMGGEEMSGADISYAIPFLDGLRVWVRFWHGDEEFLPRLHMLWDENTTRYIRYETTWYATGLLLKRLEETMPLETDRLFLRPWRPADAQSLYTYAKDPEVGPAAGWPVHRSVQQSGEIIQTVLCAPETYAICLKTDDQPIGSIGLKMGTATDMTDRPDECELGYWVGKPFWGKGIVPEAARALLERAFGVLGMRAVWCGYYAGNEKSRRVQEKLGFSYHHTTPDVDVPLLGQRRVGHCSLLKRENWKA